MFGFHQHGTIDASFASAASKSAAINVTGKNHVAIEMPAFGTLLAESTCNVYVEGGQTSTGTFRRIKDEGIYSSGAGILDWEIPSTTGNWLTICRPAARFNFIKVHLSTAATDAISCTIHVHM